MKACCGTKKARMLSTVGATPRALSPRLRGVGAGPAVLSRPWCGSAVDPSRARKTSDDTIKVHFGATDVRFTWVNRCAGAAAATPPVLLARPPLF